MQILMENLEKSVRILTMFVLACVIALVSRNTFALETESRLPANPEVTADNHPMNAADVEVTRKIRQQIMSNKTLSMGAQNIKIISQDGKVTLKGMVATPAEKTKIGEIAQNVVGVSNVTNDTQIAKK